jgi:predicted RNA-binding protein with PIN domain
MSVRQARIPAQVSQWFRGAAQTLAIVAGFVGLGLLGGGLAAGERTPWTPRGAEPLSLHYALDVEPRDADPAPPAEPAVWLVDGYNALHVGVLRGAARGGAWWSRAQREALLERVRRFDGGAAAVFVVFDGPDAREQDDPAPPTGAPGRPRLVFAASADEWLLRRAREAAPGEVAVVTADRRLAARARARGARVVSPREFLARCAPGGTTSL